MTLADGTRQHVTKIAYVMLCHKAPDVVAATARALVAGGDCVTIHCDRAAPEDVFDRLRTALQDVPGVEVLRDRLRCGWGEWSLVAATLRTLRAARARHPDATHFYLISGDCAPVRSAEHLHAVLAPQDRDWIESVDFFEGGWIKTGMKEDRLAFRHWFNERTQPRRFYLSLALQRRLGLRRSVPPGLRMMIGSQWWCLRRETVDKVLGFLAERRDVRRFFATRWIPDETVFQTLVRHLVPGREIVGHSPTFHTFTDYGMPAVFHDDQHDLLLAQDAFFARKISPEATALRARLTATYPRKGLRFEDAGDGRRLFTYLTGRGRIGLRSGPRFWERAGEIGAERTLHLVVCKKWHVAQRLLARVGTIRPLLSVGYAFDDPQAPLPLLGGLERGMEKRTRHRRAFLNLLFAAHGRDRLALCLDPARVGVIGDILSDGCKTHVLQIGCRFSDADLAGHARRAGLAGPCAGPEVLAPLLPVLRREIAEEDARIARAARGRLHRIAQDDTAAANAMALAATFGVPEAEALRLASGVDLFDD